MLADSAPGEQKGDWVVRAGISQGNPKKENLDVPSLPAFVVVDSDVSFTFDVTYMFHNHFGVELLAAYPFTHGIDAKFYDGTVARIGQTDHLPPTVSLVWRPRGYEKAFQPYVGVGVNYTMFSGEETRGALSKYDLTLDDSVGPAAVIGADWFTGEDKKWFVNANVRWINIESDAELSKDKLGTVGGFHSRYARDLRPLAAIPLDAISASLRRPLRGTPPLRPASALPYL